MATEELEKTAEAIDLKRFLSSMRLDPDVTEPLPAVKDGMQVESAPL